MTFAYLRHVHILGGLKRSNDLPNFAIESTAPAHMKVSFTLIPRRGNLTVEKQAMERFTQFQWIASSSDANDERHRRCTNGLGKFISKLSQLHYTLQFIWWSFSTWCICFVNWQYWQYWQYVEKERDNSTWKFPKFIEHWRLGKSHLNQTSSNIHGWIHLNLIVGVC